MANENVSSISKARSLEEMAEFWDTHSLADYEDEIYEVDMTFDPSARRTWIGIEPQLLKELRYIARERRISTQTLVNLWLSQRVDELKVQT
jgi:GNAT superfamily N-acetyltransferase